MNRFVGARAAIVITAALVTGDAWAARRPVRVSRITKAELGADETTMRLTFDNGSASTEHADPSGKGETFGKPAVTADQRLAVWTVNTYTDATYRAPVALRFAAGRNLTTIRCSAGVPGAWRLIGISQVVVQCSPTHGAQSGTRELWTIATCKMNASYDAAPGSQPGPEAPDWARGLLR